MLTTCHHWDLGKSFPPGRMLADRLQEISHTEAILVLSKTSFPEDWNLEFFQDLLRGPSRFARIFLSQALPHQLARSQACLHQTWLDAFAQLRQLVLTRRTWQSETDALRRQILERLDWEQHNIYPTVSKFLNWNRLTRELEYEHQGIRHYLPDLESVLGEMERADEAGARKTWSKFSLDLLHLIEHHSEHDQAVFQIFEACAPQPG